MTVVTTREAWDRLRACKSADIPVARADGSSYKLHLCPEQIERNGEIVFTD